MESTPARLAFAAELARPEGIDLPRAALTLGLIERPDLDLAGAAARLDRLAREVGATLPRGLAPDGAAAALGDALGRERGFHGDAADYDDPRNCFVHTTLARRQGMPIALTMIYIAVGRQCGYAMDGVGLPWHFVARLGDEQAGYAYLDPFAGGRVVGRDELAGFLQRNGLDPAGRLDLYLAAVTPRQTLTRMLLNIKRVYLERHDERRARQAVDLLLAISPWSAEELRDRGLLSARLDDLPSAREDLALYLQRAPEADDAARVAALLRTLDAPS
jgi:regulator of sirC expression with transglutaminase-like and TPR domain